MKKASVQHTPYLFSILTPLYNTPLPFLKALIASVQAQTYSRWELCLADGSDPSHGEVKDFCLSKAQEDPRIKYRALPHNMGISGNTNACLDLASGDYISLLDHDDLLHPAALENVANAITEKNADLVYTDEATFRGTPSNICFIHYKPDYAPDTLRANNYICHFTTFERALMEKAGGGLRSEYDGSQDFDLVLRLTEKARCIVHIPQVLYYWRAHQGSVAEDISVKPYVIEAARKAVAAHLKRVGLEGEVEQIRDYSIYRLKYKLKGHPLISILIPNKDQISDLDRCLTSIRRKTSYDNYEIIIIENNSVEKATFDYYDTLKNDSRIRVVTWNQPFNYSLINNFGFKQARGEHIVLLNNDTQVISEDWLQEMLMYSQREDVGAVGCKLYYEDGTIQHAGIGVGLMGLAAHYHRNFSDDEPGYFGRLVYAQNLSAVTGACTMMPRHVFEEVGGLDENFAVAFNDVDLCMRIRKAGYLIVFTPFAQLYHLESKTRGLDDTCEKRARFDREVRLFQTRWAEELQKGDPYYNPNLTLKREDFSSKADDPRASFWFVLKNRLNDEATLIKDYLHSNRWSCLILCLLFMMVWGAWLFNTGPRIDTEFRINDPASTYGWLNIGRQGGILTNRLMGLGFFNPRMAVTGGYLLICAAGILMGYLLWHFDKDDRRYLFTLFGFIAFTSPVMAEQFYFDMQIFEVAWAYLLCILAAGLSFVGTIRNQKAFCLLALFPMVWAFATYQIFCMVYVVLVIGCFLVYYRRNPVQASNAPAYLSIVVKLFGLFIAAFALNTLITRCFFTSSGYLDAQFLWGKRSLQENLRAIWEHILNGFLGHGVYYTACYGLSAIGAVGACVADLRRSKAQQKWLYLLAVIVLQFCPFLLTVYCGNTPPVRAQLVYPLVIAFNITFLLTRRWRFAPMKWAAVGLAVLTLWSQNLVTARLVYTEEIRAREDVQTALLLEDDLRAFSCREKPLAFVGVHQNKLNSACLRGELIGTSIFNVNYDVLPHYYASTDRICSLTRTIGLGYEAASPEQMPAARKIALDMPSWPQEGSIVETDDFIVVKLSDDIYPQEVLSDFAALADISHGEDACEEIRWCIDSAQVADGLLQVRGWAFLPCEDAAQSQTTLYLWDEEAQLAYQFYTVAIERPDLEIAFEDGHLYRQGGFYALISPEALPKALSEYEVLIGIEENDSLRLTVTDHTF